MLEGSVIEYVVYMSSSLYCIKGKIKRIFLDFPYSFNKRI